MLKFYIDTCKQTIARNVWFPSYFIIEAGNEVISVIVPLDISPDFKTRLTQIGEILIKVAEEHNKPDLLKAYYIQVTYPGTGEDIGYDNRMISELNIYMQDFINHRAESHMEYFNWKDKVYLPVDTKGKVAVHPYMKLVKIAFTKMSRLMSRN